MRQRGKTIAMLISVIERALRDGEEQSVICHTAEYAETLKRALQNAIDMIDFRGMHDPDVSRDMMTVKGSRNRSFVDHNVWDSDYNAGKTSQWPDGVLGALGRGSCRRRP